MDIIKSYSLQQLFLIALIAVLLTALYFVPKTATMIIALLIAIIGHEIMHGVMAYKYGDSTAKDAGRFSVNPLVHIDLIGSIIVPVALFAMNAPFLFGWAKPVPVDERNVYENGGEMGMVNVALAGIYFNLGLALFAAAIFGTTNIYLLEILLLNLVIYNVILGFFNLLPIPTLDGAKALAYLGFLLKTDKIALFFDKIARFYLLFIIAFFMTDLHLYFINYCLLFMNLILPPLS